MASRQVSQHIRSNAIAYAALFFAITGSAAAANQIGQIRNRDIASQAVNSRTLAQRAVHAGDLNKNAVRSNRVKPGSLRGSDLRNNTITGQQVDESTLDPNVVQFRINGNCPTGEAIRSISSDGGATCESTGQGTLTGVTTSGGLTGGGTSGTVNVGVDPTQIQSRVSGDCTGNNAVQSVAQNGTVTCQPTGTGTVTSVGAGTGLTGGPITTSGSLSVDPTAVQTRVGTGCTGNTALQSIAQDGTTTCSSAFTPATQVLASGKVNTNFTQNLVSFGGVTVFASCETFAGEADSSITGAGGYTFSSSSTGGGGQSAVNAPGGVGILLGRTQTANPSIVTFSVITASGKTWNGTLLMVHNASSPNCTYEATATTDGT